jgi:pSer/pThr/pTyr-binding forkhead associated (FHA) protein
MRVSLRVMTAGKWEGKTVPVVLPQFLIGRDPQCHLRPASPVISKRHCAVLIRDGKVFVRDFGSTNGTFVNEEPVQGECEIKEADRLKVGPLLFEVKVESSVPVNKPTPLPARVAAATMTAPPPASKDEDEAAALLLTGGDDTPAGGIPAADASVPEGSTIMDIPVLPPGQSPPKKEEKKEPVSTSNAAKAILDKYMRRPRNKE